MSQRLRTLQAAAIRLFVWSIAHEPHELGYATAARLTTQITQTPQHSISDDPDAYEIISGAAVSSLSLSWLVVPKERLWALGYTDPRDYENSSADVLLRKLFSMDGVNFLAEDKITGERVFRATDVRLESISTSVARRAVISRQATFKVREMPLYKSGLFEASNSSISSSVDGLINL